MGQSFFFSFDVSTLHHRNAQTTARAGVWCQYEPIHFPVQEEGLVSGATGAEERAALPHQGDGERRQVHAGGQERDRRVVRQAGAHEPHEGCAEFLPLGRLASQVHHERQHPGDEPARLFAAKRPNLPDDPGREAGGAEPGDLALVFGGGMYRTDRKRGSLVRLFSHSVCPASVPSLSRRQPSSR